MKTNRELDTHRKAQNFRRESLEWKSQKLGDYQNETYEADSGGYERIVRVHMEITFIRVGFLVFQIICSRIDACERKEIERLNCCRFSNEYSNVFQTLVSKR